MQININILNELKEAGAATLICIDKKHGYTIPEGYFTNFSSRVLTSVFMSQLPVVTPYTVPAAYFKKLPGLILDRINAPAEQLQTAGQNNLFTVPDGYFDKFANSVLEKVKAQDNHVRRELETIAPLLNTLSKEKLYSLPANYFEELVPLKQAGDKPSATIIPMGGKTRRWFNYAAAACIAVVLGGYFFISGNKMKAVESATQPATAAATKANLQQQLADLSDSEIESYLTENSSMAVFTNVGTDDYQRQNPNTDIQTLIKNIPDDEIQQYLNEGDALKKEDGI